MTVVFQLLGRMDERLTRGEPIRGTDFNRSSNRDDVHKPSGTRLLGATMLLNPLRFSLGRHFLRQGRLLLQQSLTGIRGGVSLEDGGLRLSDTGHAPGHTMGSRPARSDRFSRTYSADGRRALVLNLSDK